MEVGPSPFIPTMTVRYIKQNLSLLIHESHHQSINREH